MCHTSVILFTSHFILFILLFLHLLTLLLFSPISPFFKTFSVTSNRSHICLPIVFLSASFCSSLSSSRHFCLSVSLPCDLDSSPPSNSHTLSPPLPRCYFTGLKRGVCSQINHFPDDADYDQDAAEYLLREWHTHTHTHTHIQPVLHTYLSRTQHTHTHITVSSTHGYRKDRRGWWADINTRMSDSSKAFLEVCVSVCVCVCVCVCLRSVCLCMCLNAQVHGVGSLGVCRKLFFFFFHRWIERTTFTNGLFSAQDSGFTSCLHCAGEFCSYSA